MKISELMKVLELHGGKDDNIMVGFTLGSGEIYGYQIGEISLMVLDDDSEVMMVMLELEEGGEEEWEAKLN